MLVLAYEYRLEGIEMEDMEKLALLFLNFALLLVVCLLLLLLLLLYGLTCLLLKSHLLVLLSIAAYSFKGLVGEVTAEWVICWVLLFFLEFFLLDFELLLLLNEAWVE